MLPHSLIDCYIFIGVIPGPHEPQTHISDFLQPLVDDLLQLWNGVQLYPGKTDILRAALVAVTADLPALRKITQFMGHKADLGCSRCKFRAKREPGTRGASGRMIDTCRQKEPTGTPSSRQ